MAALKVLLGLSDTASRLKGPVCVLSEGSVDGSIFLHSFVQMYLKGGSSTVVVSFNQTFHHYLLIGKKMGYALEDGSKEGATSLFVDGLTNLCNESPDESWGEPTTPCISNFLRDTTDIVQRIRHFVDAQSGATLVVVDGVAEALAAGVDARAMLRFLQQLRAISEGRGDRSSIAFHMHTDATAGSSADAESILTAQLPFMAQTVLTAKALATGASSSVHGLLSCQERAGVDITRAPKEVHFKAKETGVALFPIGSAAGLL